jgi:K+-sensing histidine kinase KdpD
MNCSCPHKRSKNGTKIAHPMLFSPPFIGLSLLIAFFILRYFLFVCAVLFYFWKIKYLKLLCTFIALFVNLLFVQITNWIRL